MKYGFIFPGQGSQSTTMLAAYGEHSVVANAVHEASESLGMDLAAIIADDTAINRTENTQPAMLAVCVGVYRAVCRAGISATVFAGHSLGEYTALVCAAALDFKKALKLVRKRGLAMQAAVSLGDGAMAAVIGLAGEEVNDVCENLRRNGAQVWAANYNSPQQTVIAGLKTSVEDAMVLLKKQGAKRSVFLPVSVPSHCPLMNPAAAALKEQIALAFVGPPTVPILQNVSANVATTDGESLSQNLLAQLENPVRWVDIVRKMAAMGVGRFYECGPGKVLCGLGRRIVPDAEHIALADSAALREHWGNLSG